MQSVPPGFPRFPGSPGPLPQGSPRGLRHRLNTSVGIEGVRLATPDNYRLCGGARYTSILRRHHVQSALSRFDTSLPEREMGDKKMVERMRQTTKKQLDRGRLHDDYAQRLQHYVEAKLDAGKDVWEAPAEPEASDEEESNVTDLMQVLKERLQGKKNASARSQASCVKTPGKRKGKSSGRKPFNQANKDELYAMAQQKDIAGRSKMSKAQLIEALSRQ